MDSSSQRQGAKICKKEMVSSWEHFTKILSNLRKASDIRINCMKGKSTTVVFANRCVLEACSLQFTKLYENKQSEQGNVCQRSVINELGSSLNEIDSVIDFIYSGTISLTLDNINSVLQLAGYFQIQTLLDTCCAYIKSTLKEDNYIHLSLVLFKNEVAVKMNKKLTNLKKELEEYIRSHVCELIQSHLIYRFSAEEILLLIKAGCLSQVSDVGAMCQFAHTMLTRVQDADALKIAPMIVKSVLADVVNMSTADKLLLHSHLLKMKETALTCYGKEVFGESIKMLNDILGVKTEQEKDISDVAVAKNTVNSAGIPDSKIESVHNIGSVSEGKIIPKSEDMEQTSVISVVDLKPFHDNLAKKTEQDADIDVAKRKRAIKSAAILANKKDSVNTTKVSIDSHFSAAASTTAAQLSSTGTKVGTVVRINDKNINRPANLNVHERIDTNEHMHGQQVNKYFVKTESDDVLMTPTMPNTYGELDAVTEDVVSVKIEPVDTRTETSDYTETEIKVEKVTDEDGYQIGFQEGNEVQSYTKHLTSAENETGGYKESYCENKKLCSLAKRSPQDITKERLKRNENKDTHVTYKKMKVLNTFEDVRKMNNLSTSKTSNQKSEKAKELKKVSVIPKSRIKVVKR